MNAPPPASPPLLTAPRLARLSGVRHAFFGREGGVSQGIHASLNAGPGSRDAAEAVAENRARIAAAMGVAPERLLSAHQVHSALAIRVDGPWRGPRPQVDALVTTTPGLVLSALAADCAPVLFADADAGVIAAAHAGWKGALAGVLEATVAEMVAAGADVTRVVAAIGPCIGPASYEVGPEFEQRFADEDGAETARFFRSGKGDRRHFDLPGYCAARLARAGVLQIDALDADTCAAEAHYFSNRRAFLRGEADYGRNLSAIALVA